jgi:hypothetical protein
MHHPATILASVEESQARYFAPLHQRLHSGVQSEQGIGDTAPAA